MEDKVSSESEPATDEPVTKSLTVVTRTEWGAEQGRYPGMDRMYKPADVVFLRYNSGKETCHSKDECISVLQRLQKFHREKLVDIAYHFLIAPDGTVYEGRGWGYRAQAPDYRENDLKALGLPMEKTITLAYIGNFGANEPTPIMNQAVKDLIAFGVENNHINERHKYKECYEIN